MRVRCELAEAVLSRRSRSHFHSFPYLSTKHHTLQGSPINNDLFFSRLPVNEITLPELLAEEHLFYNIPPNWVVVVTDIRNSTEAIDNGQHQTVNLVATGSIVAVLNICFRSDLTIPFFFGGDGASFIIPPTILPQVCRALLSHRKNTMKSFGLELRVGTLEVSAIYSQGHGLCISKSRTAERFVIPVLLGSGLPWAEKFIKSEDYLPLEPETNDESPDLSGMQCRWTKVQPPLPEFEVISLLVIANSTGRQTEVFGKVLYAIDSIFGNPQNRKPISIAKLKLTIAIARIGLEMRTRFARYRPLYILAAWTKNLLGYFYFRTKTGREYLRKLVDTSDTLVIDGRINTVITGSASQRQMLEKALDELESSGEIVYGLHVSRESVMSCYVRNLNDRHIHFVDGAGGGYTNAARMVKKKLMRGVHAT